MNGEGIEFPRTETMQRLALSDSGFVFDPVTGNSFTVNATGLAILRLMQRGAAPEAVLDALGAEFDVARATAERDVIEFAGYLRSAFK